MVKWRIGHEMYPLVMLIYLSNTLSIVAGESISIQAFGVRPENSAAVNKENLQKAIDWASVRGAALLVEPSDEAYAVDGGILLKNNVVGLPASQRR